MKTLLFHNLKIILFACAVSCFGSVCHGEDLNISIHGLSGELYDNVTAALQRKRPEHGSEQRVRKFYREAEKIITEAMQPFGYYDPVIASTISHDETGWKLEYKIDKGYAIEVAEVLILFSEHNSNYYFPEGLDFPLHAGDLLDHRLYEKGKNRILRLLEDKGYIKSSYNSSRIEIDRGTKSCRIILKPDAGMRYRFGETIIEQDIADEKFLRRFLNYEKGEIYSAKTLLQLEQVLLKTGYFGSVNVSGDLEGAHDGYIPIIISLGSREYKNRFKLGAGWATDNGYRTKLGWENRLLNGRGHKLATDLQLAQYETRLDITYGIPVFDPSLDTVFFAANVGSESWRNTSTELRKGSVYYEHKGGRFTYNGGLELRDENYTIDSYGSDSFLMVPFASIAMVYRDGNIPARQGMRFSVSVKGAADDFVSDTTFLKILASGKAIISPFEKIRLIGAFTLGGIFTDEFEIIPPSLRYYAGGDYSVRGYANRSLGTTDGLGIITGGKYLVTGSIELEARLHNQWSIAAFMDAGNAMNDISSNLAKGVGGGIRYQLPFGQLRLDVARAISEDDAPYRLHFTVGSEL